MEYRRRQVFSFILALCVFALFLFVIGIDQLVEYLFQVRLEYYALAALTVVGSVILKSLVWYRLFGTGRITTSIWQITTIYFAATGIKSLLPLGQMAIQPFIAYSISKESYFNTERVFAIISVGDTMNLIPYYTLGTVGLLFFVFEETASQNLIVYILSLVAGGAVIGLFIFLIWKYEMLFLWFVQKTLVPVRYIGGVFESNRIQTVASEEAIDERFTTFYSWLGELFQDKQDVFILFIIAHLSGVVAVWGLMIVGMSLSVDIGFFTGCVMISVARFGGFAPSPGGVGGVEAVMIGVGLVLTPYGIGVLTTVTILYRVLTYWLIMGIGLSFSSWLTQEFREPEVTS